MRWLILGAALVAACLAIWILLGERRPSRPRSTVRGLAAAVAALVVLGVVAYAAHFAGFFSLPIVAVAFIPFGLAARWSVLATREARERREAARPTVPPSRRARMLAIAMWPIFVILVVLAACVGLAAGALSAHR